MKFYHCFWCRGKLNPLYMICNINTDDDTVCDNNYCYIRYLDNKDNFKMFYKKTPGACDFCTETEIFKENDNSFCCGMCMDRYNTTKKNKDANALFINLKKWQKYKNNLQEKLKETNNNIKQLNNQITFLTI